MLFLLEVYRNIVTRPICRDTRAKDRATKKFATATHTHSPFSIEDAWRATQVRWFFGTLVHHLLRLLVFQMKSLFPAPTVQLLSYWLVMQWEGLPRWCSGKESACQCRRLRRCRLVSWIGKIPGVGNGNPLQSSCLENPIEEPSGLQYCPWGRKRVGHHWATERTPCSEK